MEEEMEVRSTIQQIALATSAALWLSADYGGTAAARNAGESQARGAHHAGGQPAGGAAAGLRGSPRIRSTSWRSISIWPEPDEADGDKSALGGRHHLHSAAARVRLPGGDPRRILAQGRGLGAGPDAGEHACQSRRWSKRSRHDSRRRAWCITPIAACSMPPGTT